MAIKIMIGPLNWVGHVIRMQEDSARRILVAAVERGLRSGSPVWMDVGAWSN